MVPEGFYRRLFTLQNVYYFRSAKKATDGGLADYRSKRNGDNQETIYALGFPDGKMWNLDCHDVAQNSLDAN